METTVEIGVEQQTLAEFAEHAEEFIAQVRRTKQPIILTVNGKPAAVVQDPESFQHLAESGEYRDTVDALRLALADMDHPDSWIDSKDAFEIIRERDRR